MEECGGVFVVQHLEGRDVGFGIDVEKALTECVDFHLVEGLGGRHELAVAVGDMYAVGIDDGEMADSCAYETFGTP